MPFAALPSNVDTCLTAFVTLLKQLLHEHLVGIYITGSLVHGDFQPTKSDIDGLVILSSFPAKDQLQRLRNVHENLQVHCPANALNISYTSLEECRPDGKAAVFINGRLTICNSFLTPVFLFELHKYARTLSGVPADQLAITIHLSEVHYYLYQNLHSYWQSWLARKNAVRQFQILLFPRITEWIVLGMGRQLYTVLHDGIISKTNTAHFLKTILPAAYHPVLDQLVEVRLHTKRWPLFGSYLPSFSISRYQLTRQIAKCILLAFDDAYSKKR